MEAGRHIPYGFTSEIWNDVSVEGSYRRVAEYVLNGIGSFEDAAKKFGVPEEEHEDLQLRMKTEAEIL